MESPLVHRDCISVTDCMVLLTEMGVEVGPGHAGWVGFLLASEQVTGRQLERVLCSHMTISTSHMNA